MSKASGRTIFVCDSCGNETPRWEGRCPACGEWNTLAEFRKEGRDGRVGSRPRAGGVAAQELAGVSVDDVRRVSLPSAEMNRVLGGGIVPGSVALIAGDPGIGKSTLLLGLADDVAREEGTTLYVSGEESSTQIKLRAERLDVPGRGLFILPTTDLAEVLHRLDEDRPALVVVDSIQSIRDDSLSAEPGSVAQIRECARGLIEWAKASNVPVIMSGHVTKGGDVAGPRVLEHMVDVVLYMEGDPVGSWRLLKASKNRFGSTNEVGVFEMTDRGLVDVEDPSKAFVAGRRSSAVGSVVVSVLEGSRPLLVEVQALTAPSALPAPRRVATGMDFSRMLLVCAVLTRRVGVQLAGQDVVVNVTGGLKVGEPAADLGMALAIASSHRDARVDPPVAAIGEVGLSGEVRAVPQTDRRIREVARLGLKRCFVPGDNGAVVPPSPEGLDVVPVQTVAEAVRSCIVPG